MKITYYGHSCLLVEQDGVSVLIDPFLSGQGDKVAIKHTEVKADAIVLTHGHSDHVGDALEIAKRLQIPIIAVFELAEICRSKGAPVHPMGLGGKHDFLGFRVKFTPAFHSSSYEQDGTFLYAGMPAGVLLTMGSRTLYHAGDTALFSDMKLLSERHRIDVAALPIGDNFTMGPEDAAVAARWLKTDCVIPIHYNTFPPIAQDPDHFAQLLQVDRISCSILGNGESMEI